MNVTHIVRSITPFVVAALLLTALMWLGFWQLDRAGEKRALQAEFERALPETPQPLESSASLRELPRFAAVEFHGRYDGAHQVLLDAQVYRGQVGYRVWTPLVLETGDRVVVDRGWVKGAPDRSVLPDVTVDEVERRVRGFVSPLPEPGIRLGRGVQEADGWPRRLAWPDEEALADAWGHPVTPVLVLLAPGEPDGFVRDWDPVEIPPERHVGYAVQWFGLALTLLVIVIVLVLRNRNK